MKFFFIVLAVLIGLLACTTQSEKSVVEIQRGNLPFPNVVVAYNDDTQWALAWTYRGRVSVYNDEGTRDASWSWSERTPEKIARICESNAPVFGARYVK